MKDMVVRKGVCLSTALVGVIAFTNYAAAHAGVDAGSGFMPGFTHPVSGLDHVLAMLAVGMWGAQLGFPAIWVLPVVFPLVMAFGGAAGVMGLPLAGVEVGIALSVLVLGALILLRARLPIWGAAPIVGFLAIFHGYAHGTELPQSADPVSFGFGFVLMTGLLHGAGIVIGLITKLPRGEMLLRMGGALIAVPGIFLLKNALFS